MNLLWVFLGGAVGTAARHGVNIGLDAGGTWPLSTALVGILGSFALGILASRSVPTGARLLIGTGFLGGFTTYSAIAVQTQQLIGDGNLLMALGYPVLIAVAGTAAAAAGLRSGQRGQQVPR